jgi:sugar phosphate isomerase/epimerase
MANYETFYPTEGHKYSFEQPYGGFVASGAYHPIVRDIAYPTDPLTANQLKKVSDKINTGAQTIEVSGLGLTGGGPMKHLASIPRQHWREIDRLRKLTGVDLTFHGPLVESTGFSRGNWSEDQRVEAEKQMKAAVELAQQMNSEDKTKGIVMTFHSNNGLPEVQRRIKVGTNEDGTPIEKVVQMAVYNERSGQIGNLPIPKKDYFENKNPEEDLDIMKKELEKFNREQWKRQIESVFVNSTRVNREIGGAIESADEGEQKIKEINPEYSGSIFEVYKEYEKDYDSYKKDIDTIAKEDPRVASIIHNNVNNLHNAKFFVEESYDQLKELYSEAYGEAKKKGDKKVLDKLDKYAEGLKDTFNKYKQDYNFSNLQDKITEGTKLLAEDDVKPTLFRELKDFAVDKSSDTFSNVAIHAWNNAKKHGVAPGIISIENPPAGMSGLTRADELEQLIKASREKFVKTAVKDKLMSEKEAKETAEKIIGATWDVGHINSIQKWGYNKQDVLREAKIISKYVKHMHIADNLGFEDAELPIGMGNVPIDEILNSSWSENFKKAKKTIETGDWFSRQGGLGMTKTPVAESLSGLTSPVYSGPSMDSSAYWNAAINPMGDYFNGIGPINPEVHHSIYGGGFSGLPAYLGGEIPGRSPNSSFSGAPLD